jgi:succinate dehydrogenase/fumarate reductase flavoprotein subunit
LEAGKMKKSTEKKQISRRYFIAIAGGAAGLTAMGSMGLLSGFSENEHTLDITKIGCEQHQTDVLVIGSGMAGLFAAVKAFDAGSRVMMVSKGRLGSSGQTPFAKGIFAFDPKTSSISLDEFVESVSRSALETNNPVYTRQMAEHSLARVNELREWGFFESPLYFNAFTKPIAERNIPVVERIVITHLIKEDGKITGAAGFSLDDENIHFFNAKSVILCTGAGGFKPNGFPICDLTHDGTVMAYNIGALVTGKEWNDGHAGQAENAAACFDGWHGMFEQKPSVTGVGIRHDLGVDLNYGAYKTGNPVQMRRPGEGEQIVEGGPYRPAGFNNAGSPPPGGDGPDNRKAPPPGDRKRRDKGNGPPGMSGTMVGGSSAGMSIHKAEGLVPINDKCASNIQGLYAAGDALGSYMAGAIYTQIGSSLAGSAVQGAIAGEAAAVYSSTISSSNISIKKVAEVKEEILAPLKREAGYGPTWVTQVLQGIMIPNFIIYIKKENLLKAALAYIEELRDHHIPMLRAGDLHELRLAHETMNMVANAEMKLKASILRKESRCSHYRLDYPELDDNNWQAWINIFKDAEGDMQFEKQPFGEWPAQKTS